MDASTQLWRRAARNSVRFTISIVFTAVLCTTLAVFAFERADSNGYGSHEGGWIADVRSYLRNPLAYFAQRSPGVRGPGELIQSKHRAFKLSGRRVKPHEQVLANVRYPSPLPDYINDLVAPVPSSLFEPGPTPLFSGTGPAGTPAIPQSVVPVSFPGTGGGTGGTGNTTVPEPATWLTLIWGMALVGIGLRSRQQHGPTMGARAGRRARN